MVLKEEELQRLLSRAYFFLRFRARTVKEMQDYLNKKAEKYNISSTIVEKAIQQLQDNNYLNDNAFIEAYINSRSRTKPRGEFALRQELYQKGISREQADIYFADNSLDEHTLAKKALQKSWRQNSGKEAAIRRKKAISYLQRRGFQYDTIIKAIEEIGGKE